MPVCLLELKVRHFARIIEITGGEHLRTKLLNLGVRQGMRVQRLGMRSGPVVLRVGRSEVAIGRGMAEKIMVEVE